MAAYHADIPNLDSVGLGSSLVAHSSGVSKEIIEAYKPDIIASEQMLIMKLKN